MAEENKHPSQGLGKAPHAKPLDFDATDRAMSFRPNVGFNISAGTVTFHPKTNEVLLVFNTKYEEHIWQLPKGRKDLGEDIQVTAIRETYEETGYRVKLIPARVRTRATRPRGIARPLEDPDTIDDLNTESVGLVSYPELQADIGLEVTKFSFLYLATLVDPDAPPDKDTQNPGEGLEPKWMSVADACRSLRFRAERDIMLCAEAYWQGMTRQ